MEPLIWLASGLGAIAVIASLMGARLALVRPRDEIIARVRRAIQDPAASVIARRVVEGATRGFIWRTLACVAKPAEGQDLTRVRRRLVHAGYRGERAVEMFFGVKLALGAGLAAAALTLGALAPQWVSRVHLWTVVLGAAGFYAPNLWLRRKVRRRQLLLSQSIPDMLDILVTCVEAGLGVEAALQRVGDEIAISSPQLAMELRQTFVEIQAGVGRAEAFRRLAARTGLEELKSLAAMLVQAEMFGTSIARSLRVHSSTMRVRRTHRAEEVGATVAVRMLLPLILCILPSLFAVILGPAIVRIVAILLPTLGAGE